MTAVCRHGLLAELPRGIHSGFCLVGQLLQMAIPAPTTTLHLDIHTLPAGAYLLKVSTPNGTATRRLLVQ